MGEESFDQSGSAQAIGESSSKIGLFVGIGVAVVVLAIAGFFLFDGGEADYGSGSDFLEGEDDASTIIEDLEGDASDSQVQIGAFDCGIITVEDVEELSGFSGISRDPSLPECINVYGDFSVDFDLEILEDEELGWINLVNVLGVLITPYNTIEEAEESMSILRFAMSTESISGVGEDAEYYTLFEGSEVLQVRSGKYILELITGLKELSPSTPVLIQDKKTFLIESAKIILGRL